VRQTCMAVMTPMRNAGAGRAGRAGRVLDRAGRVLDRAREKRASHFAGSESLPLLSFQ
jgi:hypothetical protein